MFGYSLVFAHCSSRLHPILWHVSQKAYITHRIPVELVSENNLWQREGRSKLDFPCRLGPSLPTESFSTLPPAYLSPDWICIKQQTSMSYRSPGKNPSEEDPFLLYASGVVGAPYRTGPSEGQQVADTPTSETQPFGSPVITPKSRRTRRDKGITKVIKTGALLAIVRFRKRVESPLNSHNSQFVGFFILQAIPAHPLKQGRKRSPNYSACGECRAHKNKCDAAKPYCTRCIEKDRQCTYATYGPYGDVNVARTAKPRIDRYGNLSGTLMRSSTGITSHIPPRSATEFERGQVSGGIPTLGAELCEETFIGYQQLSLYPYGAPPSASSPLSTSGTSAPLAGSVVSRSDHPGPTMNDDGGILHGDTAIKDPLEQFFVNEFPWDDLVSINPDDDLSYILR